MSFKRVNFLLLLILLLAAALRFYRIDAQSLWADEGSSVAQALRPVPLIIQNAAGDIHPPLYYVLLHGWTLLFGTSELAVRALSALLGVALVALCFLLGQTLWDQRAGLLAALLAAINPFQVYYAQEARMYMLLAVLGALCLYALLRILRRPYFIHSDALMSARANVRRYGWHALYTLAMVLGLYTHYLFPVVILAAQPLWLFNFLRRRHVAWSTLNDPDELRALHEMYQMADDEELAGSVTISPLALRGPHTRLYALGEWLLPHAVALLAFVPWLPTAIRQVTTWPAGAQTFTLDEAPYVVLRALSEGLSAPRDDAWWLLAFLVLALLGTWDWRWDGEPREQDDSEPQTVPFASALVPLVFLLAPIALMVALALFKDAFLKFLLIASPPFVLLMANGIVNLAHYGARIRPYAPRVIMTAALVVLALPSFAALQNYYFDARFARDDYRAIAQTIEALARADDAIILNAPGQAEIFDYYYRGGLARYALPRQRPLDAAQTQSELASIAQQHKRIFVIYWATDESDPARVIEAWLNAHAFKASDSWYGNVRLALYANASVSAQKLLTLEWADGITLSGYLDANAPTTAGDVLPLTLLWRAERPLARRYKVFVHLLDPRGFVIAQRDAEPVGGSRPTTTWRAGETIADSYGLYVPFGTPPNVYQLEVGLYDLDSGQRLRLVRGGDHYTLDAYQIVRPSSTPPLAVYDMQMVARAPRDGLQLIGYQVDKVGYEGQRDVPFHAGDALRLSLFWRKSEAASAEGAYRWTLGALSKQTTPTDGLYPVPRWQVGEVVRDDQLIVLPADWRAGKYMLQVEGAPLVEVVVR